MKRHALSVPAHVYWTAHRELPKGVNWPEGGSYCTTGRDKGHFLKLPRISAPFWGQHWQSSPRFIKAEISSSKGIQVPNWLLILFQFSFTLLLIPAKCRQPFTLISCLSQHTCQKSDTVFWRGPCVAMYLGCMGSTSICKWIVHATQTTDSVVDIQRTTHNVTGVDIVRCSSTVGWRELYSGVVIWRCRGGGEREGKKGGGRRGKKEGIEKRRKGWWKTWVKGCMCEHVQGSASG